jgi:hypothetical protein
MLQPTTTGTLYDKNYNVKEFIGFLKYTVTQSIEQQFFFHFILLYYTVGL